MARQTFSWKYKSAKHTEKVETRTSSGLSSEEATSVIMRLGCGAAVESQAEFEAAWQRLECGCKVKKLAPEARANTSGF